MTAAATRPETKADVRAVVAALTEPFDAKEVKWKPQMVKGNRAMAMAYIDARLVMDRLDAVLGPENWQDDYTLLPDGSVMCALSLLFGGQWVKKVDVGSTSEQPDSGDRMKAAFSDALKRAAVKFGIGRYLYRLPAQWCDYDPVKKQLVQVPQLPAFAIPKGKPAAAAQAPARQPPAAPEKPAADPRDDLAARERAAYQASLEASRAARARLVADVRAERARTGQDWHACLVRLNLMFPQDSGYQQGTKIGDIPEAQLRRLLEALRELPPAALPTPAKE